jgi:UEV domain
VFLPQDFPTLKLSTDLYTHPNGRTQMLLKLAGTLPMYYQVRKAAPPQLEASPLYKQTASRRQ